MENLRASRVGLDGREGYPMVPVRLTLTWPSGRRRASGRSILENAGDVSITRTAIEGTAFRRMRTSAEEEDWIREDIRVKGPKAPSKRR